MKQHFFSEALKGLAHMEQKLDDSKPGIVLFARNDDGPGLGTYGAVAAGGAAATGAGLYYRGLNTGAGKKLAKAEVEGVADRIRNVGAIMGKGGTALTHDAARGYSKAAGAVGGAFTNSRNYIAERLAAAAKAVRLR